jgi:hypothetical protein
MSEDSVRAPSGARDEYAPRPMAGVDRVRARRWSAPIARAWLRGRTAATAVAVALALATVATALVVGPGIRATHPLTEVGTLDLGTASPPDGVLARGDVRENENGYLAAPNGRARVIVPLELPRRPDARTLLRIWAYGSATARTHVVLVAADGSRHPLGDPVGWAGKTFDVTRLAGGTGDRLVVTHVNDQTSDVLFLDRVAPVVAPRAAVATAATEGVVLLVLLTAAALLAACGRLRRHWPLPLALASFVALTWHRIPPTSLDQLPLASIPTWSDAVTGSWLGFHDGLLGGSWIGVSSLAVQLYHAFTPIVGDAGVSARSAALLAMLLALAAIYALGNRAAGRLGAVVATLIALACTPLRDAVVDGSSLPVLVLAGALLAYCVHACLARATALAAALLGAALALAVLANALWLPGAVLALPIVVLVCGEPGSRLRALGAGTLVALILLGPHLASTAAQNDGRLFADVDAAAVAARNAEFAGEGHGAPSVLEALRAPLGGRPVTLAGYVFGDHSLGQGAGGTLSGAHEALSAFGAGGAALGGIAFALALVGVAYVLLLPRLRLLVLVPLLVALAALFVAGQTPADAFAAGAVWWPALPASAAILGYAAVRLAQPRLGGLTRLRFRAQHRPEEQRA